jgi:hypothetical protein
MVRPCVARGFIDLSALRSCINVSGLSLERVVLRAIMDISARAVCDWPDARHRQQTLARWVFLHQTRDVGGQAVDALVKPAPVARQVLDSALLVDGGRSTAGPFH